MVLQGRTAGVVPDFRGVSASSSQQARCLENREGTLWVWRMPPTEGVKKVLPIAEGKGIDEGPQAAA